MLEKFNCLVEEIIDIKNNQFNFEKDKTTSKTTCKFNVFDQDTNVITIIATLQDDDTFIFQDITNDKKYSEKEFMMVYYKEYEDFKNAYKKYNEDEEKLEEDDELEFEPDKEEENSEESDKYTPTIIIKQFKNVLNDVEQVDNGVDIDVDSLKFNYRFIDDENLQNLITCNFSFEHQLKARLQNELFAYDAIGLFKQLNDNIVLIKVNLYNPDNLSETDPIDILSPFKFKEKFKDVYFALIKSSKEFLKKVLENYK